MALSPWVPMVMGVAFVAAGLFRTNNPMGGRQHVDQKVWNRDPKRAEREQRQRARTAGVRVAVGGVLIFVIGLLAALFG